MMYIFIWYIFGIVDEDDFLNKFGQKLHRLTFGKTNDYIFGTKRVFL
jgi:hypothetical protein